MDRKGGPLPTENDDTAALIRDLALANRILAREGAVDAFGHVSARHPERPDRYLLSRSRSPELVTRADILEYTLDGETAIADAPRGYLERHIHGGIYETAPEVQAVVHTHAHEVIPFSVTDVPLKPVFHVGSVIGAHVPVWDISDRFGDTDMLVTTMEQARDLGAAVAGHNTALMRGHGCVAVGRNVKEAVTRAIYLQVNARLLLMALQLGDPKYLSDGEVALSSKHTEWPTPVERTWEYWTNRADTRGI